METEPSLGVVAAAILPEEVCAGDLEDREGVVSDGLAFREIAALVGVEAALMDAERAGGRMGETSREFRGEEREVDGCVADVEG